MNDFLENVGKGQFSWYIATLYTFGKNLRYKNLLFDIISNALENTTFLFHIACFVRTTKTEDTSSSSLLIM